jgi:hypothetical protein
MKTIDVARFRESETLFFYLIRGESLEHKKLKFKLRYFASQQKLIDQLWPSNSTIEI